MKRKMAKKLLGGLLAAIMLTGCGQQAAGSRNGDHRCHGGKRRSGGDDCIHSSCRNGRSG